MNVVEVDEREGSWEDSDPRFRVYLFEKAHGSYTTRTCDITGADVLEAIAWAQQSVCGEGGLIAVALVGSRHHSGEPERVSYGYSAATSFTLMSELCAKRIE